MEAVDQFVFYPIVVLLGIFLVILSVKLVFRFILFCIVVILLWSLLAYLGFVPSPRECIPEHIQWVHDYQRQSLRELFSFFELR